MSFEEFNRTIAVSRTTLSDEEACDVEVLCLSCERAFKFELSVHTYQTISSVKMTVTLWSTFSRPGKTICKNRSKDKTEQFWLSTVIIAAKIKSK